MEFESEDALNFARKYFVDYKNNAGEYIFTGPAGNNVRIGGFPTLTGAANSNFNGQGAFPESFFLRGQDVFNGVLSKLGGIIIPPLNPVYGSPGESGQKPGENTGKSIPRGTEGQYRF